jgi:hypothetical protein
MLKQVLWASGLVLLAACSVPVDMEEPPVPLGDFSLEHNVVVAPKVKTNTAVGRELSQEVLTETLRTAIAERFDRYDGARDYHFGVSIEGYVLGRAGIPVIAAPKSAMIIRVTVWDDARGIKLNEPPEQLTILEQAGGDSFFGKGWSLSAEEQLQDLSEAAAKAIETFLVEQMAAEGWFMPEGGGLEPSPAAVGASADPGLAATATLAPEA